MDIIRGMEAFTALAGAGSFVAVADKLGTSTAAVSRQIAALEAHLGARLVHRTTRRLSLTEAGAQFLERAEQILADLAEAEAAVGREAVTPAGLLRVSAPLSFGISVLAALLPEFHRRFPDLRLDIDLSDRVVDLAHDGIDVAIRIAQAPSPNLIARRIAPIPIVTCAAPDYLAAHGHPNHPADLAAHETLSYSYLSSGDTWTFRTAAGDTAAVRVRPSVHATNGDLLRRLAVEGGGVIVQPGFIVENDLAAGRLVQVLPEWSLGAFALYAVYLSRRQLSAKVRVFIDYLVEALGKHDASPMERKG
ncbi:LysR family transcriptional regulator [Pleomorphomonas sp. JP5]|uniref:LysR family transcriptional regulator n=1 Tax=Pleomorphomonas sp. JP5 TaxID=2942998 RepID=UPI002044BB67|nr:LysR family transcriptional regulator [Pleomorphomonas sp. JP5]MCM5557508.1 LysR family transcriptional regulator [Pleomorphomonas sp. JP5]